MKVLLVAHSYPRHEQDMAGAFLLALARELQHLGHRLLVVAPHALGVAEHEWLGGVEVRRYRYAPDELETLAYAGTMHEQVMRSWGARRRLLSLVSAARRAVRQAAEDLRPDVTHVHWWFPGGLTVWPRRAGDAPVVLTSHGTDLFLLDRMRPARALARRVFSAADQVTVISTPLIERVTQLGVERSRITVVPMPVDRSIFGESTNDGRHPGQLLFVGRLVERKGAEYALRAAAALVREGRDVSLTVAGDGPERAALERLASQLDVDTRVRFLGVRTPDEIATLYRESTVLLVPSVTDWKGEQEGFGMVLVEAMTAGLPVVATRSGGIPDAVRDGETGLLVPERDAEALRAAIVRLLDDPSLGARLSERARDEARERFSPQGIARVFSGVYEKARGSRG